jgi:hypothetical protein
MMSGLVRAVTKNGASASERRKFLVYMQPRLINGRVWIPDPLFGGYKELPESDPKYRQTRLWIDSQRFVELLDWIYNREKPRRRSELTGRR